MADNTPDVTEEDVTEEGEGDVQTNARAVAGLIADYLQDRDDIASCNVVTVDPETGTVYVRIVSQGGTVFTATVAPYDVTEA